MQSVLIPRRIAAAAPPRGELHAWQGLTMGTSWSLRLVAAPGTRVAGLERALQGVLDQVVRQMSHWEPDSDLGRFNRAAAGAWLDLPPDFMTVLAYALEVAARTDGAYDPAAGALVNAWGFGPVNRYDQPGFAAPGPELLRALLARPGWREIELDRSGGRARQPGGALLDLSAVAKGFAVDKLAHFLEGEGHAHFLVEVGGELRGAGIKPDGLPWWVALEQPPAAEAQAEGEPEAMLLALHGLAVATSGDYRRCFQADGENYAHTLDPRLGCPVRNGVASVTVIAEDCMAADALSTALTVMGVEQGICIAEAQGLAARFLVRRAGGLLDCASSRFQDMLQ